MPRRFPLDAGTRALSRFESLTPDNLVSLEQAGIWPGLPCGYDNVFRGTPPTLHEKVAGLITLQDGDGPGFTGGQPYLRFEPGSGSANTRIIRWSANPTEDYFEAAADPPNSFYSDEWVGIQSVEMWWRALPGHNVSIMLMGYGTDASSSNWPTPVGTCSLPYRKGSFPLRLRVEADGSLIMILGAGAGGASLTGPIITDGLWHYIAFTWENATDGTARLYVDGAEVNNTSYSLATPLIDSSDGPLVLGARHTVAGGDNPEDQVRFASPPFHAENWEMSEVRVSTVVRSLSEILEIWEGQDPVGESEPEPSQVPFLPRKTTHVTQAQGRLIGKLQKPGIEDFLGILVDQINGRSQ